MTVPPRPGGLQAAIPHGSGELRPTEVKHLIQDRATPSSCVLRPELQAFSCPLHSRGEKEATWWLSRFKAQIFKVTVSGTKGQERAASDCQL